MFKKSFLQSSANCDAHLTESIFQTRSRRFVFGHKNSGRDLFSSSDLTAAGSFLSPLDDTSHSFGSIGYFVVFSVVRTFLSQIFFNVYFMELFTFSVVHTFLSPYFYG